MTETFKQARVRGRPLFAQFCGNDAGILLSAASHIQDQCDAIDINFGWWALMCSWCSLRPTESCLLKVLGRRNGHLNTCMCHAQPAAHRQEGALWRFSDGQP